MAARVVAWSFGAATGTALLLGAGWGAAEIFQPKVVASDSGGYLFAKAQLSSVEDHVRIRVAAEWQSDETLANQGSGTVTSIDFDPTHPVESGETLYSVDLRPVVAAAGTTPSFRPLTKGSKGQDVKQLQLFLQELGFFTGSTDGDFGPATEKAVKQWQAKVAVVEDGVVQASDLVFFRDLPSRISIDRDILLVGKRMTGGEPALSVLSPSPSFSVSSTAAQAVLLAPRTDVVVTTASGEWRGEVAQQHANEDGSVTIDVTGKDGAVLCGSQCGLIPSGEPTQLQALAITVPRTQGIRVPSASIKTTADGTTVVVDKAGRTSAVKVIATARGQAIVEGIKAGTDVRIEPDG